MAIFRAHIETASGRKSVLPVLIERPHAAEVEAELIRRYGYEPGSSLSKSSLVIVLSSSHFY
jgi:hypothetical protein